MDQNTLIITGVALIFIGIIVISIASFMNPTGEKSSTKVAVGGVIGFIPFGFGNDKQLMIIMFVITIVMMIIFYLTNYLR